MKTITILVFVLTFCIHISCKRHPENPSVVNSVPIDTVTNPVVSTNSISIQFETLMGSQPLIYDKDYLNEAGETFRINYFQFYVSNIVLYKQDGSTYAIPESYFLVNPQANNKIIVEKMPFGSYTGISYMIGVDSARNVSGVQKGALDPALAQGMFWSWNTGYVFLMLNGSSPSSKQNAKNFEYHISGFRKSNFALQTITNTFPLNLTISEKGISTILYSIELSEFFKNPVQISIAQYSNITTPGNDAAMISNNYRDMFQFQKIENR